MKMLLKSDSSARAANLNILYEFLGSKIKENIIFRSSRYPKDASEMFLSLEKIPKSTPNTTHYQPPPHT